MTGPAHDTTAVYYDPYDVVINADPYPTYARLREEAPAYHNERYDFWVLSRHADVEQGSSTGTRSPTRAATSSTSSRPTSSYRPV